MSDAVPFAVQPTSGVPIYRQIVEQVEALVAGGAYREGDLLPGVRGVAEALAINPMTVSKAYSQLEAAGVVERLRGRGMVVCSVPEELPQRQDALREQADDLALRAQQLGLSQTQTLEVVREACRRLRHDEATPPNPSGSSP